MSIARVVDSGPEQARDRDVTRRAPDIAGEPERQGAAGDPSPLAGHNVAKRATRGAAALGGGEGAGTVRYYWPNKMGRMFLLALEDVMGKNGVNAVLNLAKLRHLINNYPPNNLDLGWSFDEMGALNQALDDMYGPRGGKGLAVRAGRAGLYYALKDFAAVLGIADLAFRLLPLSMKLKIGLNAMAETFNKTSDQIVRVEEDADRFLYYIDRCPVCWGRMAEQPICHGGLGLLQEGLHWVTSGKNIRVEEIECIAMGAPSCLYTIDKRPLD